MLVGDGPPYTAIISDRTSQVRRRYTLAHEAGHAALGTVSTACFEPSSARRSRSEREADRFAAEAVLPEGQVSAEISAKALDLSTLTSAAARYRVSLEAMGLRLVEIGAWDAVFVVWRVLPRPGSSPKLRVHWAATPPTRRIYIPKYATPPPALLEQWTTGQRGVRDVRLNLGSVRGSHVVESLPKEDVLFSIIALKRLPATS